MENLKIKVSNEWGVSNQFVIDTDQGQYFQSYNSIIVFIPKGYGDYLPEVEDQNIYLDKTYWNYSKTTGKYRNLFLGENKKETEKKIKDGIYILTDLN